LDDWLILANSIFITRWFKNIKSWSYSSASKTCSLAVGYTLPFFPMKIFTKRSILWWVVGDAHWIGFEVKNYHNCKIKKHVVWFSYLLNKNQIKPNKCSLGWFICYNFLWDITIFCFQHQNQVKNNLFSRMF